jgi:hypothetical protein
MARWLCAKGSIIFWTAWPEAIEAKPKQMANKRMNEFIRKGGGLIFSAHPLFQINIISINYWATTR